MSFLEGRELWRSMEKQHVDMLLSITRHLEVYFIQVALTWLKLFIIKSRERKTFVLIVTAAGRGWLLSRENPNNFGVMSIIRDS